jgi:hypothetical protein
LPEPCGSFRKALAVLVYRQQHPPPVFGAGTVAPAEQDPLQITELVEQKQRVIAGADEVAVVGASLKGEKLVLDSKVANFVEVYGRQRPMADIPKVTVMFGPPVVNGTVAKNPTPEAIYPKGVPDQADAVVKDGSLVITVGKPVEGREKRRATLIEGKK